MYRGNQNGGPKSYENLSLTIPNFVSRNLRPVFTILVCSAMSLSLVNMPACVAYQGPKRAKACAKEKGLLGNFHVCS